MIKIEIYPFKDENFEVRIGSEGVDFYATPIITTVLGWINGEELSQLGNSHCTSMMDYMNYPIYGTRECLMAVVEIDGSPPGEVSLGGQPHRLSLGNPLIYDA